MELVSAIITTHKRHPDIVERALKSIINQTYSNIEIIVIDDSPSEYDFRVDVKNIVSKYDGVIYVQNDKCQGACAARNIGLSLAKGKYIGYLDDDDEWLPHKIEKMVPKFENDKVALVYCGREIVNDSLGKVSVSSVDFRNGKIFDELILNNFVGSTSFPLIRTDALREIGGFDVEMQSAQDFDVWLRLAQFYEVDFVQDILVRYYIHSGEQITKNSKKKISGLERINFKNHEYLQSHRKARYIRNIEIVLYYSMDGQIKKAFREWIKSVFTCPFKIKTNLKYLYRIIRYRAR